MSVQYKNRILHLFDDEKVVNRTIESFEKAFPQQNLYYCFINDAPKRVSSHDNLFWVNNGFVDVMSDFSQVRVVLIHFLNYQKILFVQKYIKQDIPVFWFMWGADYYNSILDLKGFKMYYQPRFEGYKYYLKKLLYKLGYKTRSQKVFEDFIRSRITHCVTFKTDFDLCYRYAPTLFSNKEIALQPFFYYPIDQILSEKIIQKEACGNIILIGNSNSVTNNYSYVFKYLKNLNLDNKKIVSPLNYGSNTRYKEYIIRKGRKLFGDKYQPLLNFLPLDEYNELLLKSEICIFPHWRQEGNGNVIIALYLGAKVFMSNRSSLFTHYKGMGITIFELEKINDVQLHTPLAPDIKKRNRKILIEKYNMNNLLANIRKNWGGYLDDTLNI